MKLKVILALDTSTKTGWALNEPRSSGVENFSEYKRESNGAVLILFRAWLESMIQIYRPNLIIYEQPHHRGKGTTLLMGLVGIVHECVTKFNCTMAEVHSATLKKYATGNGHATKEEMIEKAKEKKWKPKDDNECDALWLLDYIQNNIGNEQK